ncbi:MAG TPA: hypothetical protein DDZ89_11085 [Clostridiales bacterium]|nr:hypothetical protein [Clostridiales bacterium]
MNCNYTCFDIMKDTRDDEVTRLTYRMLLKWVNFADRHYNKWNSRENCGHFFGGSYWYEIETTFAAFVYAVVASYGEFDPSVCHVPVDEIRAKAISAIRYLGFTHDTGPADCVREKSDNPFCSEKKWGGLGNEFFMASQHGTSVSRFGLAAWLLWDRLDNETKGLVCNVLEDYANRWMDYPCPSGTYTDTQTEENAWTAMGIATACFLMKDHPNWNKWQVAMKRWAFNSCTTYMDAFREDASDGRRIYRGWINTVTTHPDYTTENHCFVHPNYLACGIHIRAVIAIMCQMAGVPIPEAVTYRWNDVYDNTLKLWSDMDGTPIPIQGQDWWYYSLPDSHFTHAVMHVIKGDVEAGAYEKKALQRVKSVQDGNENGCFYEKDGKKFVINKYQSAFEMDHMAASSVALTFLLHKYAAGTPKSRSSSLTGVYHYPYGNSVIRKSEDSFACFTYRNNCMVFCFPKKGLWFFTPRTANLIGEITVEGFQGDPGLANFQVVRNMERTCIKEEKDSFTAHGTIDRGLGMLDQQVGMIALPNDMCVYSHIYTANKDIKVTSMRAGIIGIRNENYVNSPDVAKGYKTIYAGDLVKTYKGYMGGDDIVDYYPDVHYMNIDDEMSIIALYNRQVIYVNVHHYPKWVGLEDVCILDYNDKPFGVTNGEKFGKLLTVMSPNQTFQKGKELYESMKVWDTKRVDVDVVQLEGFLCYVNHSEEDLVVKAKRSDQCEYMDIYSGVTTGGCNMTVWEKRISKHSSGFLNPICRIKGIQEGIEVHCSEEGIVNILNRGSSSVSIEIKHFHEESREINLKPLTFHSAKPDEWLWR